MNNRGQSLISFVLVVPIILLILFMVYDIGSMVSLKEELNNINYLVIDYGLDNLSDSDLDHKLNEMIVTNKDDIDNIAISVSEGRIDILLQDRVNNKLSLTNKIKLLSVKSHYVGYMENDKKVIRKDN